MAGPKSGGLLLGGTLDPEFHSNQHDASTVRRRRFAVILLMCFFCLFWIVPTEMLYSFSWLPISSSSSPSATTTTTTGSAPPDGNRDDNPPVFSWLDILPARSLEWRPCYSPLHDCARLDVPMDWQNPSEEKRVILAVIRLRATNLTHHRGPVFFNPGGPGGSGIWALLDHGKDLQAIVGRDHDLVAFDPRGVGSSVPRIECWKHAQERAAWELQDIGAVDSHPGVIYDAYARAQLVSRVCETNEDLGGEEGILAHSSTAYHARDMLEILEQMGEQRLKYWGFSYGTVLGGTFAAMYPDKVERMVNDGNVDYQEWYTGEYFNFLRDTDKVMQSFYRFCHLAGPLRCAFYAPTPLLIESRLDSLLEAIRLSPVPIMTIPFSAESSPVPQLVTYTSAKRMLSTALYQPALRFPRVAEVLAGLEARNATAYRLYVSQDETRSSSSLCLAETVPPSEPLPVPLEGTADAFPAIMCSDALPTRLSPAEFEGYALKLQDISRAAGSVQVGFRLSCVGRVVRPKWRFEGRRRKNEKVKTRFPILFVNNVADNVTPLVSAEKNSRMFEDSAVLVQEGYGHTSLAAGSRCTAEKVRRYFQEGKVPGVGERMCGGEVPWGVTEEVEIEEDDGRDDEVERAVARLRKRMRAGGKFN
ncbi:Alpha/Beta hydrolase protein [Cladorrhinum samala]|uniref:Alpha/Beta hydrolase protein n=1 Tax=Cladorrhinum samala TaxID=585594 RepID=A0AAV9HPV4_9PEZI|nr:Alpha/Beta hydrolase protein [Cladorrhinum samala]